jgi:hypothetical protein
MGSKDLQDAGNLQSHNEWKGGRGDWRRGLLLLLLFLERFSELGTRLDPKGDGHRVAGELCRRKRRETRSASVPVPEIDARRERRLTSPSILADDDLSLFPAQDVGPLLAGSLLADLHSLLALSPVGEDDGESVGVLLISHSDPTEAVLVVGVVSLRGESQEGRPST